MVSPPVRAQQQLSYIAIAALSDCRLLAVWHRPAARPAFLVPPLTEDTAGIAAMDLSLAVVDMLGVPQPVVLLTILIATLGALWFIISKRKSAAPRVVVRNAAEMRVAVENSAVAVVELDPAGVFDLSAGGHSEAQLVIKRAVHLVSGAGGQARLVGSNKTTHLSPRDDEGNGPCVCVEAKGVVLEGLAVDCPKYSAADADRFCRMEQVAVNVGWLGAVVLRGCELAGMVHVGSHRSAGTPATAEAELRGCVVHDCGDEGLLVEGYAACAVLSDTTIERCGAYAVYSTNGGLVRLEGDGNTVRNCGDGDYGVEDGRETGGRIDGVPQERVTQLQDDWAEDAEDEGGYGAFSRDDVDELMSQGVKPWDDDAGAVLEALAGM
jgi:hypothetical protein